MRDLESLKIGYNAMIQISGLSIEEANAWYDKEMSFRHTVNYSYPEIIDVNSYIKGKKVTKLSGRPFLSTYKTNTIKGICEHPHKNESYAYTFEEDKSEVEIYMCKIF